MGVFPLAWKKMDRGIAAINSSQKARVFIASGEALELWLLKVACGAYYSGVGAADRTPVREQYEFDIAKALKAFSGEWEIGAGVYFGSAIGQKIALRNQAGFAPITNTRSNKVVGAKLILRGIELDLIFDTTGANTDELTARIHRPTDLIWDNGPKRWGAFLTWPDGVPAKIVRMDLVARERHDTRGTTILPIRTA